MPHGNRSGQRAIEDQQLIGRRIREARQGRGMTMAQLAAALGVTQPAISQWESGKEKPGRDSLGKLAQVLGIGNHQRQDALPTDIATAPDPAVPINTLRIDVPVYGTVVGGDGGDFSFNGQVVDYVRRPHGVLKLRSIYALWVTGDSMSPWNKSGDLIYVTPSRPPVAGDHVVVEMAGGSDHEPGTAMVKLLAGKTATHLRLQQYNPAREFSVPLSRVKAMHKVLSLRELLGV